MIFENDNLKKIQTCYYITICLIYAIHANTLYNML